MKKETTITLDQRRWLSQKQAAEWTGFSVQFFKERIEPYISSVPWGTSKASPISYDKNEIDRFLESMKQKPLRDL